MWLTAKAEPNDPPASPDAGWIYILSNNPNSSIFPFATQLSATPPDRHKLLELVIFFVL